MDPSAIPPFLLLHCDVNSGCPPPPLASHAGCRRQLDKCSPDDPDTLVNTGCVLFKEGKYEPARQRFNEAPSILGYKVCGSTLKGGEGRGQEGMNAAGGSRRPGGRGGNSAAVFKAPNNSGLWRPMRGGRVPPDTHTTQGTLSLSLMGFSAPPSTVPRYSPSCSTTLPCASTRLSSMVTHCASSLRSSSGECGNIPS